MFNKIQEIFSIPELKRRVMFTLGLLVVYRVGSHITTPGVDASVLTEFFARQRGTILGLYDLFAGGNLEKATIFALGIMPYISASIILQLFQAVIPHFEKLAKEGEEGRKKITQYTRYGTVVLSIVQGFGIAIFLESMKGPSGQSAVMFPGWGFRLLTVLTLTCGTIFVMWLGEQINDRGIGNGISLIITIGILARYPIDALNTYRALTLGQMTPFKLVIILMLMVAIIAGVIFVTQGQRRIPVQYAKRVVGRRVYGGQASHIPLSVNIAGVIPIIFAQSLIMFPGTIAALFPDAVFLQSVHLVLSPGHWVYIALVFAHHHLLHVFLYRDRLESGRPRGQHEEVGRFHPGHSSRQAHRRVHRSHTDAHHAAGSILPGLHRRAARHPDHEGQRAVPFRRHRPVDRGRRDAGYTPPDRIALADAPL